MNLIKIKFLLITIEFIFIEFIYGQNQKELEVENNIVILNDGEKFETNLYELNYIGQVNNKSKQYLILSGKQCLECDANISLYIISPTDGEMKYESEQDKFSYPGKLFDYSDNKLIANYRTFYGEIFNDITGVIWFQKELNLKKYMDRVDIFGWN